jgi:predicted membrane protein (TIGR00267 family)
MSNSFLEEDKKNNSSYLRNFVFGVEDSLVSTVGLLSGIAIAGIEKKELFITAIILISVEAISMSAGSFLSESSEDDYLNGGKKTSRTYLSSIIMFLSYFISGFVPLAPYILFPIKNGLPLSVAFSLIGLGVLGFISAKISKTNILRSIMRMVFVGGLATITGVIIGILVK